MSFNCVYFEGVVVGVFGIIFGGMYEYFGEIVIKLIIGSGNKFVLEKEIS